MMKIQSPFASRSSLFAFVVSAACAILASCDPPPEEEAPQASAALEAQPEVLSQTEAAAVAHAPVTGCRDVGFTVHQCTTCSALMQRARADCAGRVTNARCFSQGCGTKRGRIEFRCCPYTCPAATGAQASAGRAPCP